jgi:hypothetical protein
MYSTRYAEFDPPTQLEACIIGLSQIIKDKRGCLTVCVFIRAMHGYANALGAEARGQKVSKGRGATGIYTQHDFFKPLVCRQPFAGSEQPIKRHFGMGSTVYRCKSNQA